MVYAIGGPYFFKGEQQVRNILKLMKAIIRMPFPWNLWVFHLSVVNLGGAFWYVDRPAGGAAIMAMALAFGVMAAIHARRGFVRLLGLGHIVAWTPLSLYFVFLLATGEGETPYRWWLGLVVLSNTLSLVLDIMDVARYARGERLPIA